MPLPIFSEDGIPLQCNLYLLIESKIFFLEDFTAFLHIVLRSSYLLQWNFHKQDHSLTADIKTEVNYIHRKTKIVLKHKDNNMGSFINLRSQPCAHPADLKMDRHKLPPLKLSILSIVLKLKKKPVSQTYRRMNTNMGRLCELIKGT